MKLQEITFPRPVKVLQVFRNVYRYGKDKKSFEQRAAEMEWKNIASKSGYVRDGELYLPEAIMKEPAFGNCGLITIEDNNYPMESHGTPYWFRREAGKLKAINRCFYPSRTCKLEFMQIKSNEELELFLKWGYFEVGIPERKDHMLALLRSGTPVEVKINGKTESSMTARRAREFLEQQYIFDYLGEFRSCRLLREPYDPVIKQVPEGRKVVDLLKRLW